MAAFAGPMVRIRLPPAASHRRTGPAVSGCRARALSPVVADPRQQIVWLELTKACRAEPMVRIHLPPAASLSLQVSFAMIGAKRRFSPQYVRERGTGEPDGRGSTRSLWDDRYS